MTTKYIVSKLSAFGSLEFLATGGFQYRAPLLNYVGNVLCAEVNNFISYQTAIAAVNTFDFEPAENCGTGDCSDCRIHTGRVTSRCKDAYAFDFRHVVSMFSIIQCKFTFLFLIDENLQYLKSGACAGSQYTLHGIE